MKVQMTRTVTIVGGAKDDSESNDVTYNRDAEYDVTDAVGKSFVACGQAVEVKAGEKPKANKKAGGPAENKAGK